MPFNVGDKILFKNNCNGCKYGKEYTVQLGGPGNSGVLCVINKKGTGSCSCQENWQLISNKKNINMKEKFIQMFLSEPEKSFRKAGITNGDGLVTEEGSTLFLTWLLGKNGTTFKTEVVDELLKKEEK